MIQPSFLEIAAPFKAIFLDSYGVLKNYNGLIDGVQDTVHYIRNSGKAFRILTNDASRSQEDMATKFKRSGLQSIESEDIITSGMMAKQYLQHKIPEGTIAYLGTVRAANYILETGLKAIRAEEIDLQDIEDIAAFVFLDDEGFDWNIAINKTVNLIRRKNIPVIVANSDKLYPISKTDVHIATGGIARLVENILGRKFIRFGKPDTQMFNYAFEDLNQKGASFSKSDILMVGDTLHTDILGGNKFGIKTMLVMTGNTSANKADVMIRSTGIIPDFICESIVG